MHPEHGLLLASEFIPLAQESGLITPIDWWVFEEACRQVHEWHLRFPIDPPIQLNVNLTGSLLVRPDLPVDWPARDGPGACCGWR